MNAWEIIKVLPVCDIVKIAEKNMVDPIVCLAICHTESSGDRAAFKHENNYRWLYCVSEMANSVGIPYEDELRFQETSHGLFQVMGAVLREYGFMGKPSEAYDTTKNIEYGIKHLRNKFRAHHEEEAAIAAYNAGSPRKTPGGMWENQRYVDKVYSRIRLLNIAFPTGG